MFQSTHPHGVRQISTMSVKRKNSFNPRTRMGCDKILDYVATPINVSIHAPAWGATCHFYKSR